MRGQIRWLGVIGGALMAASLFLSQVGGPELGREDSTFWGNARGPSFSIPVGLVVLTLAVAVAWPRRAWIPGLIWIVLVAQEFGRMIGVVDDLRGSFPGTYLPPWPWVAAFLGGGCAVVASVLAWRDARPRTDVAAFD